MITGNESSQSKFKSHYDLNYSVTSNFHLMHKDSIVKIMSAHIEKQSDIVSIQHLKYMTKQKNVNLKTQRVYQRIESGREDTTLQ